MSARLEEVALGDVIRPTKFFASFARVKVKGLEKRSELVLRELGVLKAVTEYLDLRERQGDLVWSLTDPASKDPRERARRVRKGWADITVCVRGGRFLGIELKRPGRSRTSKEQLRFRELINGLGGIAVECRSVAEVRDAVELCLIRRDIR